MSDWEDIKQRAQRIRKRLRAESPPPLGGRCHAEGMTEGVKLLIQNKPSKKALEKLLYSPPPAPFGGTPGRLHASSPEGGGKKRVGREISGTQMAALKTGTMKIDARLDLHGRTQHDAFWELNHFMKKHTARGARLLLIITGKGKNNEGVLRQSLPGWLMEGEFRHHVLTIHPAHHRHGGDGATYVLLRRPEA